jgi:hypothetical protein
MPAMNVTNTYPTHMLPFDVVSNKQRPSNYEYSTYVDLLTVIFFEF